MQPLEAGLPPNEVHSRVRAAHRGRRGAERTLAFYLREVRDRRLAEERGFADVFHYASLAADLSPRRAEELLDIAETLDRFPRLAAAYASADLPFSKVRALCRIVSPETEEAWLLRAPHLSWWALEALVERAQYGDTPEEAQRRPAGDGGPSEEVPFILHLAPETHSLLTEAFRRLRRARGGIEEAIAAFAAAILERGTADAGPAEASSEGGAPARNAGDRRRPLFQWVLYRCESCGGTRLEPGGHRTTEALGERAGCDAEVVALSAGGSRSRTIPPRVRRAVLLRDGGRCRVPGCRFDLWTDVHHIVARSRGGDHRAENLVVLCTAHHAAVHEGRLVVGIEGGGGVLWRHADGTEFGSCA